MELQWDFENDNQLGVEQSPVYHLTPDTNIIDVKTQSGAKTSLNLIDIDNELRKIVTRIFENDRDYHDLDLVSKYQQVFEIVSFIFEDYRNSFENIMEKRLGDLNQEQQQVEALVFCSWISIEVLTALSKQVVRT